MKLVLIIKTIYFLWSRRGHWQKSVARNRKPSQFQNEPLPTSANTAAPPAEVAAAVASFLFAVDQCDGGFYPPLPHCESRSAFLWALTHSHDVQQPLLHSGAPGPGDPAAGDRVSVAGNRTVCGRQLVRFRYRYRKWEKNENTETKYQHTQLHTATVAELTVLASSHDNFTTL